MKNSNAMQESFFEILDKLEVNKLINISKKKEHEQQSFFTNYISVENKEKRLEKEKRKIERITYSDNLDYLFQKENLSPVLSERYNDNISAIRLIKRLEKEGRKANVKEQGILAKYSGFGGLSNKFSDVSSNLELKLLLGEEYNDVKKSTLTAYYTNLNIIKVIHKIIGRLGFEKGCILEPSAGIGRFLGALGEKVYYNSKITTIEIEKISHSIIKQLYQSVENINSPYEDTELKDNSFDLIVSNIPFGNIPVYGSTDQELNKFRAPIHDYYFLKSIKKLRDGGLLAFITSTHTMDKKSSNVREIINNSCNLLGAFRLPCGTFVDTNTSVDVIFLQKDVTKSINYGTEYDKSKNKWIDVKEDENNQLINEYYINNPHMLLGKMKVINGPYGPTYQLINEKKLETKDYEKMIKYFPCEIYESSLDDSYMHKDEELIPCIDSKYRDGEIVVVEGDLYQRQGRVLVPKKYVGKRKQILINYTRIKDKLKAVIERQLSDCTDDELHELQEELSYEYERFNKTFGYINDKNNKKILEEDIMYYSTSCLEELDIENKTYFKSDIFSKRTIRVSKNVEVPSTYEDAMLKSYNSNGKIDLDYISKLMNKNKSEVIEEMLQRRLIYHNPLTNNYESKDEYLSGNVKKKLRYLEKNYKDIEKYKANIEDLKLNQPEYVYDVYFDICSTWIPLEVKRKFIMDTLKLDDNFKLTYSHALGYKVTGSYYVMPNLNSIEWGTTRKNALDIVLSAMNMKSIMIYDYILGDDGEEKRIKNPEQTQLALEKENKWKTAFIDYVLENNALHKELLDIYNEECVLFKEREYKNVLTNLRINPNITLKEHQLKAASRIITSNRSTLLLHSVGLGKSFTSIAAMMEWGRIGKYKTEGEDRYDFNGKLKIGEGNILFVVPNSLCMSGQFAREFLKLYPYANILATTPNDFTKANRRKMLSKIVMHKYDAIIIPHSVLGLIPIKPESELELMKEEEKELLELIAYYSREKDNITVKEIEKKLETHRVNMRRLNDIHRDNGAIYWEDLNIDRLVIDESQFYKNVSLVTKLTRINGVSLTASKRAKDLQNKIRLHRKKYGEKGIVFLSATPISNSVSELYVINEYLGKEILRDCGINTFDDFASRFGEIVKSMEIDVTGQSYRISERFSKFKNVPELVVMFRLISDIVFTEDVNDINVPKLKNDKPTVISVEPTKEMTEYIDGLVERAENIWSGKVKLSEDNMLMVVNSGRLLAVSPNLVGVKGASPKIEAVCKNVYNLYTKYQDATQVIFCDLGTPGGSTFCVYDEIKNMLIDYGIPENEIAYIHDGSTDAKRKELLEKFNKGVIKIMIGSTQKLGIGVNLQKKLKFSHDVDCPWKSSEIEQRYGRIVRQGNKNNEVEIFRYVVNKSFDAYSWQCCERKAKFIKQVISAKTTSREIEDVDATILSYGECKACACGDKRIMRLCELNNEVQRLELLEKGFREEKYKNYRSIELLTEKVKAYNESLGEIQSDYKAFTTGDHVLTITNNTYSSKDELLSIIQKLLTNDYEGVAGEIDGLKLRFEKIYELGNKVYKGYLGKTIKFNTKKSAKVVLENILNMEERLKAKINYTNEYINKTQNEIDGLKKSLNNEFKEKERLRELQAEKNKLETELSVNKEKIV